MRFRERDIERRMSERDTAIERERDIERRMRERDSAIERERMTETNEEKERESEIPSIYTCTIEIVFL